MGLRFPLCAPLIIIWGIHAYMASEHTEGESDFDGIRFSIQRKAHVMQKDTKVQKSRSRVHCAILCARSSCCLGANFNRADGDCEMLSYPKMPMQTTMDHWWDFLSVECIEDRESPEGTEGHDFCSDDLDERGAQRFVEVPGYILTGNDEGIAYGMDLEGCKEYCLTTTEFQCRSIDYIEQTERCYASHVTADDDGHDLEYKGTGHIYAQRTC